MDSKVFGYARVSTKEQNLDRQYIALAEQGIEERNIIVDKESGKDLDRKGYQLLKSGLLRRGDTLIIKSLDRLSRNKGDIKNELEYFKNEGIRLRVLDLPTTCVLCIFSPASSIKWWILLILLNGALYLAIPSNMRYKYMSRILRQTPYFVIIMLLNLFHLKGMAQKFNHTQHG